MTYSARIAHEDSRRKGCVLAMLLASCASIAVAQPVETPDGVPTESGADAETAESNAAPAGVAEAPDEAPSTPEAANAPAGVTEPPSAPQPDAQRQPRVDVEAETAAAPAAQGAASPEPDKDARTGAVRDARLLDLLLSLMHPDDDDARARAAEALGDGLDPRASGPLRRTLSIDTVAVQQAAVESLAGFRGDAVEQALTAVLRDSSRPSSLRVAAVHSLGVQGTRAAAEQLWSARGLDDAAVSDAADVTLASRYPRLHAQWLKQRPEKAGRSGLMLLSGAMALHGGAMMTGLASVAGGDPGVLSFVGGSLVGGIAPYLLTLDEPLPLATGAWIASTTTWGLASGVLIGGAAGLEDDPLVWSLLGGQALGLGAGLLTYEGLPYDATRVALIDLSGIAGVLAAGGVLMQFDSDNQEAALAGVQIGLSTGLAAGLLLTPQLEVKHNDHALIAEATVAGAWIGGWLPALVRGDAVESEDSLSGVLLGTAAGFYGGTALSQVVDQPTVRYVPPVLGMVYGSALGGGTALLLDDELSLRAQVALLLAAGAGGAGMGVALAEDAQVQSGTVTLNLLTTGWGLWQGVGFASALDAGGTEAVGATLLGIGAGGAVGGLLSEVIEPTSAQVGVAAAGGVWGGWLSGWTLHVFRKHDADIGDDQVLLATLIGSDVGLALGVLALSPVLDVPEERLGWINLGGALGMGLGTSVSAVFSDRVAEGNLIGTGLGLVVAGVATGFHDFTPEPRGDARDGDDGAGLHDLMPGIAMLPSEDGGLDTLLTLRGRFDL